jgi:WD40 repeat protein
VFDVAFSPDGTHVAAAASDGAADVTDLASGDTIRLRGYRKGVNGVAFSPNGQRLATAADDGVRVWDWARAEPVLRIDRTSGELFVGFSPTGRDFSTFGFDYKLKAWSCATCGPVTSVLDLARSRARRDLTAQERETFNIGG